MDKHVFWPVSAILLGVIVLMINLGYLPKATALYWPILLVLWGLMKLVESEGPVGKKK